MGKVANSLNLDPKALVLSCMLIMFLLLCTVPPAWTKETPLDQPMHQLKDGDVEESDADRPLVFLSNKTLPPMVYLQDGKRVGIVVDLGIAIKGHMIRPVDLKYLDWSQAQQFVLEGKADAVLHINPSEKRKKLFDFSDDFLESEFSIFIRHPSKNIYDISDLSGLNVGVLDRGLCFNLLSRDPSINLVGFPDILPGFQSLHDGGLDAVVMDRHVGTFLLAENNIEGIRTTGEPIDRSNAAIAVKKGNTELLVEINKALAEIKTNGTYAEIIAKWQPKEVVYQTREQSRKQTRILLVISVFAGTAFAIILLILVWNRKLKQRVEERTSDLMNSNKFLEAEIAGRKKIATDLRLSRDFLENLTDSMGDVVFSVKMPERKMEWINDRSDILGYTPEECLGKGTEFFYDSREDYLTTGQMLAEAEADGKDVIHTEAKLKRKNGEVFPADATLTLFRVNNEVVSLTGILRDITARKMADQKIMEYQKRLKALASQLTLAEEKERQRLAADLHDHVSQSLALAKIQVASVRKKVLEPTLTAKLDEVSNTLQQTLQATRHLMADLSPPLLSAIGLSAAISELLEEIIAKRYDIKTEFTDDVGDHRRNVLESNLRAILFRNVRELVTNVVKHARAKKVSVHIQEEDKQIKIIVKDDGIGFDPEATTPKNGQDGGFGLFSIQERMSDMGGAFEIVSERGNGSRAVMIVPFDGR